MTVGERHAGSSYIGSILLNWKWKDHVFVYPVILLLLHGEAPADLQPKTLKKKEREEIG